MQEQELENKAQELENKFKEWGDEWLLTRPPYVQSLSEEDRQDSGLLIF
jgi:hypothetical protein